MFLGDVSSHNNVTDWRAYIADTPAVWTKATQASGQDAYANPLFVSQFNGAAAAGGLVGAYHFGDVRHDPAADADYFVGTASPSGAFADGRLLPMLDIENTAGVTWTAQNAPGWIDRFIQRYRDRTGQHKIAVYASRSFWQSIMQPDLWADDGAFLIAAAYVTSVDWSKGLNQSGYSHPRLAAWQYTNVAPIAGMQNPGDRSRQVAFTQADLTLGGDDMAQIDEVLDRVRSIHAYGFLPTNGRVPSEGGDLGWLDKLFADQLAKLTAQNDALKAQVAALSVGGIDLDALAAKVAALIQPATLDVTLSGTASPKQS